MWVRLLSGEFNLAFEGEKLIEKGFWQIVNFRQNDSLRVESKLFAVLCRAVALIFIIVLLLCPAGISKVTKLRLRHGGNLS